MRALLSYLQSGAVFIIIATVLITGFFVMRFFVQGENQVVFTVPDGIRLAGIHGPSMFAAVADPYISNASWQKRASRALCFEHADLQNCEVYLFKDDRYLPREFPIKRYADKSIGHYRIQNGSDRFRLLHHGAEHTEQTLEEKFGTDRR